MCSAAQCTSRGQNVAAQYHCRSFSHQQEMLEVSAWATQINSHLWPGSITHKSLDNYWHDTSWPFPSASLNFVTRNFVHTPPRCSRFAYGRNMLCYRLIHGRGDKCGNLPKSTFSALCNIYGAPWKVDGAPWNVTPPPPSMNSCLLYPIEFQLIYFLQIEINLVTRSLSLLYTPSIVILYIVRSAVTRGSEW